MHPINIIEEALVKANKSPQFSQDLINYCKYLALKFCPQKDLKEFEIIFTKGSIHDFALFGSRVVPNFEEKILEYAKNY